MLHSITLASCRAKTEAATALRTLIDNGYAFALSLMSVTSLEAPPELATTVLPPGSLPDVGAAGSPAAPPELVAAVTAFDEARKAYLTSLDLPYKREWELVWRGANWDLTCQVCLMGQHNKAHRWRMIPKQVKSETVYHMYKMVAHFEGDRHLGCLRSAFTDHMQEAVRPKRKAVSTAHSDRDLVPRCDADTHVSNLHFLRLIHPYGTMLLCANAASTVHHNCCRRMSTARNVV